MISREEAKRQCLEWVDKEILEKGEDSIYCLAPSIGKNSWTLKEYRDAVINDVPMEGCIDNPIDDYLNYIKWKEEHGR